MTVAPGGVALPWPSRPVGGDATSRRIAMTTAIIHLGLPKTGTTSFQVACAKGSNQALAGLGVLYPLDEYLTYGAIQHQALAVGVQTESAEWIDRTVRRMRETAGDYPHLLISSERFAAILNDPATYDRMRTFRDACERAFERVEFVCTIRSERAILTSTIRTKLDGHGMPLDGAAFVRNEVATFFQMNRALAEIFAGRLRVLRFEDLVAHPFPTSLLKACTGVDFALPDLKRNTSEDKDARRFLMSNVRMLLFNYTGEPSPHTPKIHEAYRRIIAGIELDPEIDEEISDMLTEWIDRQVDAALKEHAESLDAIYGLSTATT